MSRIKGRGLAITLVVVALVVGLIAFTIQRERGQVLVVGDSLMVAAADNGLSRFGWDVDARSGRMTPEGIVVAASRHADRYRLVVVALGTNDGGDDATTYGRRVDQMMKAIGPEPDVVWVNVDTHTPELAIRRPVNQAIQAATGRYPNLRVGDWDKYVTTVAGFDAMRAGDGVHYAPEGSRVRARWTLALRGG